MSNRQLFAPRPLALAIKWASFIPLLLISNTLFALEVVDGVPRTIDQDTIANDYDLRNGATLNVNGGTQHGKVTAAESTLNVAAGSALTAVASTLSTVVMQGADLLSDLLYKSM